MDPAGPTVNFASAGKRCCAGARPEDVGIGLRHVTDATAYAPHPAAPPDVMRLQDFYRMLLDTHLRCVPAEVPT